MNVSLEGLQLHPRGDGPFQVLERIGDNAYKLDLPSEYGNVSTTFNVSDLSLFDVGDSRTNSFEDGGHAKSQVGDLQGGRSTDDSKDGGSSLRSSNDILKGLDGPMT